MVESTSLAESESTATAPKPAAAAAAADLSGEEEQGTETDTEAMELTCQISDADIDNIVTCLGEIVTVLASAPYLIVSTDWTAAIRLKK